ncbi:RAS guanyl-releasing protein 4 [Osmerus eperlanus]|uniref:RAS guanyl-releasing protein 4 n=1 Tax=Osmerus eperlanus TaxID=29151 RepID=UPI002E11E1F2
MHKNKRKCRVEGPGGVKSRRPVQRRMTCPSPQEISRALQTPTPLPLTRAASLDELIQLCLHCFDSEGRLVRGSQMVNMTLMMHIWVVPSQTFALKLLALYKDCPVEKGLRRSQIYNLIRQWISQFPAVFETDPRLEHIMGDLWTLVRSEVENTHSQFINSSCVNTAVNISQSPSPSVKKRKVSLLFDHMEADEMAKHLSYLEFKNFCNVSFLDYHSYVVRGSVRDNPALERSVMMCNGVSQWVQLMILSRHTAQQRAQVFTKFIHVAQKLRSLQNFNTLMAVTGGLCHSSISRLKDTASLLPPDITKALSEMTELLSSSSNYSNYRRVYNECVGFKVPILGVHLKDLISLNEALPDYLEEDKINLGKLQHLHSNISDLLALHSRTPPEANKDLLHLLTLSLDLYYTEDEIYELSYTKEPKNPKIQPVAPVKAPAVAEWGSGVTPRLDPATISKHVKQMVDSIMKNYDLNQDGYISLEDFEKIAANFPFSFPHESDRKGEISREEITSYFIRGMSVCAKLGLNFSTTSAQQVHNLHETTYKRPTFCDSCGGFLWGVKRGYHCKDCGMNCHRHCKDLLAIECMKKHKVSGSSCPCTPVPDFKTKANSWSSEEDTFIFPQSNEADHNRGNPTAKNITEDSTLSDGSTQTDPGFWTPQKVEKSGGQADSDTHRPPPERARGASMPVSVSFLLEKMEELELHSDKSREPD